MDKEDSFDKACDIVAKSMMLGWALFIFGFTFKTSGLDIGGAFIAACGLFIISTPLVILPGIIIAAPLNLALAVIISRLQPRA